MGAAGSFLVQAFFSLAHAQHSALLLFARRLLGDEQVAEQAQTPRSSKLTSRSSGNSSLSAQASLGSQPNLEMLAQRVAGLQEAFIMEIEPELDALRQHVWALGHRLTAVERTIVDIWPVCSVVLGAEHWRQSESDDKVESSSDI